MGLLLDTGLERHPRQPSHDIPPWRLRANHFDLPHLDGQRKPKNLEIESNAGQKNTFTLPDVATTRVVKEKYFICPSMFSIQMPSEIHWKSCVILT
jgi:hypothetical protein